MRGNRRGGAAMTIEELESFPERTRNRLYEGWNYLRRLDIGDDYRSIDVCYEIGCLLEERARLKVATRWLMEGSFRAAGWSTR
jgi:hypothetical protein